MPENPGIFLIQNDGQLTRLLEKPYDSEAILQQLLAKYPEVLAGERAGVERKWVLVKREAAVPGDESGVGRWSLDHLFLDSDGIPTLVEVKRSTDTRLRREVVGQMLDYAANAVAYWPVAQLEADFRMSCTQMGKDPDEVLTGLLGDEAPEAFWQRVKLNLGAGKIRLVFVADVIPTELQRIVEFLNVQMDPAEVIAIEVRQFVGENLRSLVPRVIGQTVEARTRKAAYTSPETWTPERFVARVLAESGAAEATVAQRILDWAGSRNLRIASGKGMNPARLYPMVGEGHDIQYTVAVCHGPTSFVEFQFPSMRPPFDEAEKRQELTQRIESALGTSFGPNPKFPRVSLAVLSDNDRLEKLLETMDWVIQKTQGAEAPGSHD